MLLGLGCFALLVFVLSLIPYSVRIESRAGVNRVSLAIAGVAWSKRSTERVERPRRVAQSAAASRRTSPRKVKALILSRGFVPSLIRLSRRVIHELRPRGLRLHLRFGLGDPSATARVFGALIPLFLYLSSVCGEEIRFEPDLFGRSFRLDFQAEIRVVPAVLIGLVIGYLLTGTTWRAILRFARA